MLESYTQGRWFAATDDGMPLPSAVDGAEVARISSTGLDLRAVVDYGRRVGGPALAALTFHERAGLLKQLGLTLMAGKEEFYELSRQTGATVRDSAVDIDGGFGTILSYASKARRELPNDTIVLDGEVERLGKKGAFLGQHIYTSRQGVAVQINAFNFPVWGFLEKLAPAFLAGVPSIIKPASATAYLTEFVFRRIIETGLLPQGSVQLLCGSARDLLDHLDGQDSVAFTGSAGTAALLRAHPRVVSASVHFTAEADSLNASILGADASPGTPEFDLYVKQLVTEMTVKAGQKCTAIRRALVPVSLVDDVVAAASSRLAKVVVGDPAAEGVTMGPLASIEQRDEVLKSLRGLTKSADVVFGDPDTVAVVGADAAAGAFLSPVLLRATDPTAPEIHDIEAFGPVATVIGYRDVDDAIALAARGAGSLVASIVTADDAVAAQLIRGLAPYHGRLLVLNEQDARESTGHGSPLPVLVHGGPGGPAAAKNSAASAASCITCSAPRCKAPPTCSPRWGAPG